MYHFSCLFLLAAKSRRKPHDGLDAFLRYKRTERGCKATSCPAVAQGQVKPCTKPSRQTYRNSGRQKVNGFMCLNWVEPEVMENWAFIPPIWLNLIVSMLFFIVNMQCLHTEKGVEEKIFPVFMLYKKLLLLKVFRVKSGSSYNLPKRPTNLMSKPSSL